MGYDSLSAFHVAFRRVHGEGPGRHRASALTRSLEVLPVSSRLIASKLSVIPGALPGFVDPAPHGWTDWRCASLEGPANRGWQGDGPGVWFGAPLLQLRAGRRVVRGMPFEVIDPEANGGRAIVVLRSPRAGPDLGGAEPPERVRLPFGKTARHLAWLHAVGWISWPGRVASYHLLYADGEEIELPVEALGNATIDGDQARRANIQDWYFAAAHFRRTGVIPVNLAPARDPLATAEYLYAWCWENPRPDTIISAIELRGAPGGESTMAWLAFSWR